MHAPIGKSHTSLTENMADEDETELSYFIPHSIIEYYRKQTPLPTRKT